jgi:hypothetical protein
MKWVLLVIICLAAAFFAFRLFSKKPEKPVEAKDQPLRISKNSDLFNKAFAGLLNEYYSIKDALVDWDTLQADRSAAALSSLADSLPIHEMKADTPVIQTAEALASSISDEAKAFQGEHGIEDRRRSFNMLTEEMYNLVRTVRYDGSIIYHIKCPMAFRDSQEAFWLSNTSRIVNPYLGTRHPVYKNKMVGCGEVDDSLHFGNP